MKNVLTNDMAGAKLGHRAMYSLPVKLNATFLVNTPICARFFRDAVGIRSGFTQDAASHSTSSVGRLRRSEPKTDDVRTFFELQQQFHEISPDTVGAGRRAKRGEPDSEIARYNGVQLPYPNRKEVYQEFCDSLTRRLAENPNQMAMPLLSQPCTLDWFLKIWRNHYPNVFLRKHLRFARCSTCVDLRHQFGRMDGQHDKATHEEVRRLFKHHIADIKSERFYYHHKRNTSAAPNSESLSLIFDGADQGSYSFPYFHEKSKDTDGIKKQRYHLIGVIAHGVGTWVYTMLDNWNSDSNVTIEVLQRVLTIIEKEKGVLPKTLYLQMDNCTKDNKNKYVFGYLCWLVQRGVFQTIEVSFLPVGHTHEDIDQLFSRLAIHLRGHNAISPSQLFEGIKVAFKKYGYVARCEHLHSIANMKKWIDKYVGEIHNHSKREVQHFQIKPHDNGASMVTKLRGSDVWDVYDLSPESRDRGFHLLSAKTPVPPFTPSERPTPLSPGRTDGQTKLCEEIRQSFEVLKLDRRVTYAHLKELVASLEVLSNGDAMPFSWNRDGQFQCERDAADLLKKPKAAAPKPALWRIAAAEAETFKASADKLEIDCSDLHDGDIWSSLSSAALAALAARLGHYPTKAEQASAGVVVIRRGAIRDHQDQLEFTKHQTAVNAFPQIIKVLEGSHLLPMGLLVVGSFLVLRPTRLSDPLEIKSKQDNAKNDARADERSFNMLGRPPPKEDPDQRDFWIGEVTEIDCERRWIKYWDWTPYERNEGLTRNQKGDQYGGFYFKDSMEGERELDLDWNESGCRSVWTYFSKGTMSTANRLPGSVQDHIRAVVSNIPPKRQQHIAGPVLPVLPLTKAKKKRKLSGKATATAKQITLVCA